MNWGNFISGFRLPNYLSKVTMAVFSQQNISNVVNLFLSSWNNNNMKTSSRVDIFVKQ